MEYKLYYPGGIRTWQHEFRELVHDALTIRHEPDPDTRRPDGQLIESHPVLDWPESIAISIDRSDEEPFDAIPLVATGSLNMAHYRYTLDLDASTNDTLVYRKDF
jgi:hypothetical protein